MIRARPGLAAAAAITVAALAAQAASVGEDLLRRSQWAERAYSYRGIQVIQARLHRRPITASLRVIHRKPATTRIEYLSPPSVAGTIILRRGESRWRRRPGDSAWHPVATTPHAVNLDLLLGNYELRVGASRLVANRRCIEVLISPRRDDNPSKRLWVDQETGLVLGTELLNWRRESITSSFFRDIEINPDLSRETDLLDLPIRPVAPRVRPPLGFRVVYPRYLPPGYVFVNLETVSLGPHRAVHLRYTDGLNTISLFEAPAAAFAGRMASSAHWGFTQLVQCRQGDLACVLLGDINPVQLRRMADSMPVAAPRGSR